MAVKKAQRKLKVTKRSKLKVVPRRKSNLHNQPMLDLLLQALSALHGGSGKLYPGVQVAWLPDQQKYYASVHVFDGMHYKSFSVTHKAGGATAEEALCNLAKQVYQATVNPLLNFQQAVRGKVIKMQPAPGLRLTSTRSFV